MTTIQINSTPNKGLNIALWVAQVLLGALFLFAGGMKVFTPIEEMAKNAAWVKDLPWLMRFIGVSELAGGLGLILPSLLRIKPVLTPIAAIGLLIILILAAGYHIMHNEFSGLGGIAAFALILAFIIWGRLKKAPISPK